MTKLILILSMSAFAGSAYATISTGANAKNLQLIVLGKGEITQSSLTEASRSLSFPPDWGMDGKLMRRWKDVAGGKRCVKGPSSTMGDDACLALLTVKSHLNVNEYELSISNEKRELRFCDGRNDSLFTTADIKAMRDYDFSKENTPYLDLVYDVNSGTVFLGHHGYYLKQIRIYVDASTKEVSSWDVVKVGVPIREQ